MLEFDYTWTFASSTGGGADPRFIGHTSPLSVAFTIQTSGGSSGTGTLQSGPSSAGPWFNVTSTSLATGAYWVGAVTGPVGPWVRAYANCTGMICQVQGIS